MVEKKDESIGYIARGYKIINIDGNVFYLRDCNVEADYPSENEMDIVIECIDINGNTVRLKRKIIFEGGKFKKAYKWEIL